MQSSLTGGITDLLLDEQSFVAMHNRMLQLCLPTAVDAVSPDDARRYRPFSNPNTMFRRTERSNSAGSCATMATRRLNHRGCSVAMSFPSSKTRPLVGR